MGRQVEPLPLVGRGWGGVLAPQQNPSRLPATLPTRGRVKNAARPQVPYPIALPQAGRREVWLPSRPIAWGTGGRRCNRLTGSICLQGRPISLRKLPTRGRVKNAAPPQVPYPIALPQVGRRNLLQRFVSLAPLAGVRRTGRDTRLDPGRVRVRGNCPDPAAKQEHQTSHRPLNIS